MINNEEFDTLRLISQAISPVLEQSYTTHTITSNTLMDTVFTSV